MIHPPRKIIPLQRPVRWVALAGFMGTGKSRIGRELAKALYLYFVDTDEAIERAASSAIPHLFNQQGEAVFREYERLMLERCTRLDRAVISLGGGAFISEHNQNILKARGPVVVLRASPETIYQRTRRSDRPLLKTENPLERIRELMKDRESAYAQGDIQVSTDSRPSSDVVQEIVEKLWLYRKTHPNMPTPKEV